MYLLKKMLKNLGITRY